MIEHPYIDRAKRVSQPQGDVDIAPTRLGDTRGMIVGEYHSRGIVIERSLDHLAGIDRRGIYRTGEHILEFDNMMLISEKQTAEYFTRAVAVAGTKIVSGFGRIFEHIARSETLGEMAVGQFADDAEPSRLGGHNTRRVQQAFAVGA